MNNQNGFTPRRLLTICFYAAIGLIVARYGSTEAQLVLTGLIFAPITIIFLNSIYQLGQLVAGLLMGQRFSAFSIYNLHIYQKASQLRIKWYKSQLFRRASHSGFMGLYFADFTNFRRRMFWSLLGGPLANMLILILITPLYMPMFPLPQYNTMPPFFEWLSTNIIIQVFWLSVYIIVVTVFPLNRANVSRYLLMIVNGGIALERYKQRIQIADAIIKGVRPRDWDAAWIDNLFAQGGDAADLFIANELAHYWALDRGEVEQAEAFLSKALDLRNQVSLDQRSDLLVQAAYFKLRYRSDSVNADEVINELGDAPQHADPITYWRMLCAAQLVRRNYAEAWEITQHVLALLDQEIEENGFMLMDRDEFKQMAERAPA